METGGSETLPYGTKTRRMNHRRCIMRKMFIIWAVLFVPVAIIYTGCSENSTNGGNGNGEYSAVITQPTGGDTVISTLIIRAEADPAPDCIQFEFDTFETAVDSTAPYSRSFDISLYPSGNHSARAIAYWDDTTRSGDVSFFIEHIECDSAAPVVLNGDTIPEDRIIRNAAGCVITIDLSYMDITDPNCIAGIEIYSATLKGLSINYNPLTSIDLSPLASCTNLDKFVLNNNQLTSIDLLPLTPCINLYWLLLDHNQFTSIDLSPVGSFVNLNRLWLHRNQFTSIDLSPLSSCTGLMFFFIRENQLTAIDMLPLWELEFLEVFELQMNDLDSVSCAHVCDFIDEHPDCNVRTDCVCP